MHQIHFLCSDNFEMSEYLHDNTISLPLSLKYGLNVNVHGWVSIQHSVAHIEFQTEKWKITQQDILSWNTGKHLQNKF